MKNIPVTCCSVGVCPNCRIEPGIVRGDYCKLTGRSTLINGAGFPAWCPLEDAIEDKGMLWMGKAESKLSAMELLDVIRFLNSEVDKPTNYSMWDRGSLETLRTRIIDRLKKKLADFEP